MSQSKNKIPLYCRHIKCNYMNHNTSIILYDKRIYFYNLPFVITLLLIWLFGFTGLFLGLLTGYLYLALLFSIGFAFFGYFFARTFIRGKLIRECSIDQIRKITCEMATVRIFFSKNNEMLELKMSPRFQRELLNGVSISLREDFRLDPQVNRNMLWIKEP